MGAEATRAMRAAMGAEATGAAEATGTEATGAAEATGTGAVVGANKRSITANKE
jgi:hypothetical protein